MSLMSIFEKLNKPTDKGTCHNYIEIYNKELNPVQGKQYRGKLCTGYTIYS